MTEKELDRVLGAALRTRAKFFVWFLVRTAFDPNGCERILVRDDWPWGNPRGDQVKFRETDILLVCQQQDGVRFALHIENKGPSTPFGVEQASDYPKRARAWAGVKKWGNYSSWKCVLVAPKAYSVRHAAEVGYFDEHISYEELAECLPEFGAG